MNSLDVGQNERALDIDEAELEAVEEQRRLENEAIEQAERLREALAEEIAQGSLLVRLQGTDVIVQILERDSFASGSAQLEQGFLPTLARIGNLLDPMAGAITVSGHTDNVPISTSQYRSNWDLSAARAATVVHEILATGPDPDRLMISGHADTQPRAPNDNAPNRALNRRIDITLATSRERHGGWTSPDAASPPGEVEAIVEPPPPETAAPGPSRD